MPLTRLEFNRYLLENGWFLSYRNIGIASIYSTNQHPVTLTISESDTVEGNEVSLSATLPTTSVEVKTGVFTVNTVDRLKYLERNVDTIWNACTAYELTYCTR